MSTRATHQLTWPQEIAATLNIRTHLSLCLVKSVIIIGDYNSIQGPKYTHVRVVGRLSRTYGSDWRLYLQHLPCFLPNECRTPSVGLWREIVIMFVDLSLGPFWRWQARDWTSSSWGFHVVLLLEGFFFLCMGFLYGHIYVHLPIIYSKVSGIWLVKREWLCIYIFCESEKFVFHV